ncbi:MAG: TIGR02206 family membrane protein [Acidobacteria bacterium]|nr:TIGR02206 family membrane protein [Acidobacteriota bacterium]
MTSAHPFHLFGPSHLAVLGLTAAVTAVLVLAARRDRGAASLGGSAAAGGIDIPGAGAAARPGAARRIAWLLAGLLLLEEAAFVAVAAHEDLPSLKDHLPFQLCDWVIFAAVAALLRRRRLAYELAYFWGLSGTLQALLTPDLAEDFPSLHFVTFQTLHATVIVAILYLTLGLGMRPWPRSILRVWLWLQGYVAVTAAADWLLDSNYGYLLRKPVQASLYDYLGPWPVYLLSLEALSLALFLACYAPFALLDRLRRGEGMPIPVEP